MISNRKMLVVDGSSLLSTCYYGTVPKQLLSHGLTETEKERFYKGLMHTAEGFYTNGIFPFFKIIFKILETQEFTDIAFCFDKSRENLLRRKAYPEYKAQRHETPAPLKQQYMTLERALMRMGFKVFFSDEQEADDFAGSIVKKMKGQMPIYLLTKDVDYLQLVDSKSNVFVWLLQTTQQKVDDFKMAYGITDANWPDKVIEHNDATVFFEHGVWPEQIPDLKGLTGDSSDNIPGVKNLASAAAPLLEIYKTVEGIYQCIEGTDAKTLQAEWKETLKGYRSPYNALTKAYDEGFFKSAKEAALGSKALATINCDIPVEDHGYEIKVNREGYTAVMNGLNIKAVTLADKFFA